MREIKLSQGKIALIDDEDYERVSQFKWFAIKGKNTFYAATWIGPWRERKILSLHHFVNGKPEPGYLTDHADRNGLNNQKFNLRNSTFNQNGANRTSYGSSKYLGVTKVIKKDKPYYRVFIGVDGKQKYLGFFKNEDEAALAYNEAAIKYHGEFANLNILPGTSNVLLAQYDTDTQAVIVEDAFK